jgi:hypothetical protein
MGTTLSGDLSTGVLFFAWVRGDTLFIAGCHLPLWDVALRITIKRAADLMLSVYSKHKQISPRAEQLAVNRFSCHVSLGTGRQKLLLLCLFNV